MLGLWGGERGGKEGSGGRVVRVEMGKGRERKGWGWRGGGGRDEEGVWRGGGD